MDLLKIFARFVFACVSLTYLIFLGVQAVRYAKSGSGGAHVLGAALILMGFGNMQDPTMEMAALTRQTRRHEEDDSGDPPESDERSEA